MGSSEEGLYVVCIRKETNTAEVWVQATRISRTSNFHGYSSPIEKIVDTDQTSFVLAQ